MRDLWPFDRPWAAGPCLSHWAEPGLSIGILCLPTPQTETEASRVRGAGSRFGAKQQGGGEGISGPRTKSTSQPPLTSALYMRIRPWFTLDQEGTALMFHSWLECSAKGPVFI